MTYRAAPFRPLKSSFTQKTPRFEGSTRAMRKHGSVASLAMFKKQKTLRVANLKLRTKKKNNNNSFGSCGYFFFIKRKEMYFGGVFGILKILSGCASLNHWYTTRNGIRLVQYATIDKSLLYLVSFNIVKGTGR